MITVECPICKEEIEITNISYFRGSYDEPESFDYEFVHEHHDFEDLTVNQQKAFDLKVYNTYIDSIDNKY